MHTPQLVKLTTSLNGNNKRSETFLVFSKEVKPQQNIVDELLGRAEDEEEQQRILESSEELQPIQVAFKLQDNRIIPIDSNCVLFAFLPTQKETHLKFLIQARYQTTPARDNIPKPHENPWNRWLVEETADFLPEILEQLKIGGLLKPAFFNVLPLKGDVENEFKSIAEALQKAMQERAFVPTEKEGNYAKAENVFYPHRESLRELVDCDPLYSNSSWLHPEIRDTEEFRQCFKAMREAGVREIGINQVLDWLEKQESNWFESKCEDWLRSLYLYLNSQKSELDRIKKLPLVRRENGEHVCADGGLAFFPPDTEEEREDICSFLDELPIVKSTILEGEERNSIEAFLKDIGVKLLRPEEMINKWIIPQYSRPEKPSVAQNLIHVRYLFKIWSKISDTEIKKEVSETPILRAYKGFQQEVSDFVVPCDAYLSQTYTGDTDLENYFSASDGKIWFIDDAYLEDDSDRKDWLKFLKAVRTMDTPKVIQRVLKENLFEACANRGIQRENITISGEETIEDYTLHELLNVLHKISEYKSVKLSQALWCLLVKFSQVSEKDRNTLFKGNYIWCYRSNTYPNSEPFDAKFYCQLTETAWLPDEKGNLHRPSECFAPTSENKEVLGDSVAYLPPDFDINQDNEPAQWLARQLGVNLNADTDSVINYLQTLSGSKVNVEDIEPLYRFLDRQRAQRKEEFEANPLIFTPEPEPCWWQADKVFWEDESAVFGNDRGYLKNHYTENLKSFFIVSGVSERAAPLDYVRGIQDVTATKNAEDKEVRDRVKFLYGRLWRHLQEGGSFLEDEEWQEEWEETREDKCWLGKKGDEWGFFFSHKLVWNDHQYLANIFEGQVPFWGFDDDLLEFVNELGIEGCSQAEITPKPSGFQEKDEVWSDKVRNLYPFIHAFLKAPGPGNKKDAKPAKVLTQLSVCRIKELEVTYKLKEIRCIDPQPPQSFLDEKTPETKLWIASIAERNEYAELISDALHEHFNVRDLGRFTEDLLTKNRDKVLSRWKRKGLQTDLCVLPQEMITDNEQFPEPIDEKLPEETSSEHDVPEMIEPKVETPIPHEVPGSKTNSREGNPAEDKSAPHPYIPNTSQTRQSGGHWKSSSNEGSGSGGHGGRGGNGPGEKHEALKKDLANNPVQLGEGLELVKMEYKFISMDSADILFKDKSGNPVTVEVESYIPQGNYVGLWQAVKYKHLAAVEYSLPCDQVRSILAAPTIPDDVKEKCQELGIEPIEVPLPNDTGNSNV